jgi:hypothetical protein
MIFFKRNNLHQRINDNLLDTIDGLKDEYELARENERNLSKTGIDLKSIHVKTLIAKAKYNSMVQAAKKQND